MVQKLIDKMFEKAVGKNGWNLVENGWEHFGERLKNFPNEKKKIENSLEEA